MRIGLHPGARDEVKNAAARYAAISVLLGERFYRHVETLLAEIAINPVLPRAFLPPDVRRHFKRPFPYAVVYVTKLNEIWVLAVMHFKQPPDYWVNRLDG
jgi:hypothetical protein